MISLSKRHKDLLTKKMVVVAERGAKEGDKKSCLCRIGTDFEKALRILSAAYSID